MAFPRCRYGSEIADDHVIVELLCFRDKGRLIVTSEPMGFCCSKNVAMCAVVAGLCAGQFLDRPMW